MPCCAFAAFIFGQIVIGLDAFKRFALRRGAGELPDNPATEWRLLDDRLPAKPSCDAAISAKGIRWFAIAASLEVLLAIGGIYGLRAHLVHHHPAAPALGAPICRNPSRTPAR